MRASAVNKNRYLGATAFLLRRPPSRPPRRRRDAAQPRAKRGAWSLAMAEGCGLEEYERTDSIHSKLESLSVCEGVFRQLHAADDIACEVVEIRQIERGITAFLFESLQ